MPVYEYRCTTCEREFEYQQRMSDPPRDVCENCGGPLERIISRTAFQLKGGGWYKDLYASTKPGESGGASSTKSDSAAAPAPAASSDSGSSAPAPAAAAPAPSTSGGSSGSSGSGGSGSGSGSST
ncbi:MAG: zinc ribbon domain-containing protein [Deltaproteobacteria bacterium]|nr:zinc ribbon domain-containing protein [Deltaproteobacteria bacterium]